MSLTTQSAFLLMALGCQAAIGAESGPVTIDTADLKARQPQLAVDGDGLIHLAFGAEGTVYHAASRDDGLTFDPPTAVGKVKFLSLGMRRGPRIAAVGNEIVVSAVVGELGGGRDGDLLAWRSENAGKTWAGPTKVNDVAGAAREGLHAMAAGPGGVLLCAWLDLRNSRTEVAASSSRDVGRTWSKNAIVYRSPDGSVCECCQPSVAFAADGAILVMWRNSLKGNRDMYFATSRDAGNKFGPAKRIGTESWTLDACPMDGGAVAVDEKGRLHAVWRRDKKVYLTEREPTNEAVLGGGEQPWLALTKGGAAAAWLTRRPGSLMLKLPKNSEAIQIAEAARDPVIISHDDAVIVAWEAEEEGRPVIKVQRKMAR